MGEKKGNASSAEGKPEKGFDDMQQKDKKTGRKRTEGQRGEETYTSYLSHKTGLGRQLLGKSSQMEREEDRTFSDRQSRGCLSLSYRKMVREIWGAGVHIDYMKKEQRKEGY